MQARMVNQSLFSGVWGKGAFMWLAVKSIKSQRQRGDLECKEACSILVISKLHRPLLTLLIRSLGKSHSGHNIFFFLFSCLRLRSQPLCKESLYAAPRNSAWVAAPLSYCSGKACRADPCTGPIARVLRTPGECLQILCLKNLLYCSSFNAAGVCRDQGIIFDTCRKELCLHWFSIPHY